MAFLEKQLEIRESTLPGAGNGLFTKTLIPKGTRIVEYKGRIITWKQATEDGDANRYIFHVTDKHVIDALPYKKALARYANDARGLKKITGLKNNSEYVIEDKRVYIDAIRDIPAGSEILVSYGKDYWDTVKANEKLDKK